MPIPAGSGTGQMREYDPDKGWRERLVCPRSGTWQVDMVVSGPERG